MAFGAAFLVAFCNEAPQLGAELVKMEWKQFEPCSALEAKRRVLDARAKRVSLQVGGLVGWYVRPT